jgi:glutamate--cysteine ligase
MRTYFQRCIAGVMQVNLDFESEADMVEKFRIGLALQPISTALFALSPFRDGKPTKYESWRSHVWTDVDNDRCGNLPFVFEEGFGFERYVDYVLDVPMYFVYRHGEYKDATGLSFRDFLKGELSICPGAPLAQPCLPVVSFGYSQDACIVIVVQQP